MVITWLFYSPIFHQPIRDQYLGSREQFTANQRPVFRLHGESVFNLASSSSWKNGFPPMNMFIFSNGINEKGLLSRFPSKSADFCMQKNAYDGSLLGKISFTITRYISHTMWLLCNIYIVTVVYSMSHNITVLFPHIPPANQRPVFGITWTIYSQLETGI